MSITVLSSSLHILVAIIQFILASLTFLSDQKARVNRSIGALLVFLGLTSIAVGSEMNALTLQQAYPWVIFKTYSIYVIGTGILFVSIIILRPSTARKRLVSWPLVFLCLLPLICILLDVSGTSSLFLDQPLFFSASEFEKLYSGGYLPPDNYIEGAFAPIIELQLFGSFIFTLIYPLLTVAIIDRKSNPENSRIALILFVSILIVSLLMVLLIDLLPPTILSLIVNFSLTVVFAYVGIQKTQSQLGMSGFRKLIGDISMYNKLLMASIGIILPTLLFVGFSSFSFYQQTVLNIYNNDLTILSMIEGDLINQEIESLISSLDQVADYYLTQFYLDDRYEYLTEIPLQEIPDIIQQEELEWQSEGSEIRESVTSVGRIIPLESFQQNNPIFKSLFLTDKYGAVISATKAPESYNQSQFHWWWWVTVTGQAFIGNPVWDEEAGENLVEIAVPVFSTSDDQTIKGALYSLYSIQSIQEELSKATENQIISFELISQTNEPFTPQVSSDDNEISATLELLSTDTEKNWHVIQYNNENNIVVLDNIENDKSLNNLSWNILALAPVDEALASVFLARTGIYILMGFTLAGSIGMTIVIAGFITTPLSELTRTAERIIAGEKDIQSEVTGADEIGTLASTFNRMTQEMSHLVDSLEQTVKERTASLEQRAHYLEAAAEVGHAATSIYNLEELLPQVVDFISERFGFYQVGIFILNETGEYAVMRAASSEGGKQMLARNHKLEVGKQGIVGFVTGTRQARIALDVGEDAVHFDNPELPHTRSEMALPLFSGDQLFGALDVQSTEPNAFSEEDISALRVLANQVSMAINNAQLFEQLQDSIESERRAYGEIRGAAWKEIIRSKKSWGYRYSSNKVSPASGKWTEDMIEAANLGKTVHSEIDNQPTLAIPIQISGQVLGIIRVRKDINESNWSEDDIELMETLTDRLSQSLESARLFQTTQKQAAQEQITSEISSNIRQSLDIETVLQTAAKELGEVFKAQDIIIRMKPDEPDK